MAREIIREEYRPMADMPVAEIMPYLFPHHWAKYVKFKKSYCTKKKHVEEHEEELEKTKDKKDEKVNSLANVSKFVRDLKMKAEANLAKKA
jgi:hypothetical protein